MSWEIFYGVWNFKHKTYEISKLVESKSVEFLTKMPETNEAILIATF